jgi:hypothetical protein
MQRTARFADHIKKPLTMKRSGILFTLLLMCFVFSGCRKNKSEYKSETAVITGFDGSKCYCCWGLIINFDNDPDPNNPSNRIIDELPADANITSNSIFPIYVKVDWKEDDKCSNKVDIVRLARR